MCSTYIYTYITFFFYYLFIFGFIFYYIFFCFAFVLLFTFILFFYFYFISFLFAGAQNLEGEYVTRSLEINPGSTQKLTGISFLIKRNCRSVAISEIFLQSSLKLYSRWMPRPRNLRRNIPRSATKCLVNKPPEKAHGNGA